jgi:hypothetical protein
LAAAVAAARPDALSHLLFAQRLTALLGARAIDAAGAALPPAFHTAVEQAAAANRARGLALEALASHVASRLEAAGIPTLPLKGPFAGRRLHGDYGARAANDLDLLVDPARLDDAVAVVTGLGYRRDPVDDLTEDGRPDIHHTMRDPRGRLTRIELHWRVHWYEGEFSSDMLARSAPGGSGLREPTPADELAALLLFYARDGFFGLRGAADVAAWWDVHGETLGAAPLETHWRDYPALRRPLAAAAAAAERIVGVPADRILPPDAQRDGRARLAVQLASWSGAGELDQLRCDITLVDLLLSPPGDLRPALRRHVLLTPEKLGSTYHLRPGRSLRRAGWRVLHPPKMAARYLLGLGGAVRRGSGRIGASSL